MTKQRLFVLGDSISMQYGPHLERFIRHRFDYSRKTGEEGYKDLDNPVGANGGDSSMCLNFLKACEASGFTTDCLLFNAGLHDLRIDLNTGKHQIALDEYRKNLSECFDVAKPMAGSVLWVRTTPVDDEIHNSRMSDFHRHASDVEAYNAVADEQAREGGAHCVDLHTFTAALGSANELFADHVHFVSSVQESQAAFIAGYLDAMAE